MIKKQDPKISEQRYSEWYIIILYSSSTRNHLPDVRVGKDIYMYICVYFASEMCGQRSDYFFKSYKQWRFPTSQEIKKIILQIRKNKGEKQTWRIWEGFPRSFGLKRVLKKSGFSQKLQRKGYRNHFSDLFEAMPWKYISVAFLIEMFTETTFLFNFQGEIQTRNVKKKANIFTRINIITKYLPKKYQYIYIAKSENSRADDNND